MKKLLLPSLLIIGSALTLSARGTTVATTTGEYAVDTVFHAKVGPGTTHTQLRLTGPRSMNVFYVTIDRTTPGVSIRTLSGGDKVAGSTRTSVMAQNHTREGLHYFAGSNGDFYHTGGHATNGSSIVGTPINAFATDREMFRTSGQWYQFSVDIEGIARICRLDFSKGTATIGDKSVPFKAINNDAPNNAVTLYTSKYWGSSNQTALADKCSEVTARLVEGDNFWAGCSYRLEITSTASHTGDLAVPDNGFVILGRGTADEFVKNLAVGDIVTFDNVTMTADGEKIVPSCIVSGNPKNVGGGANLNSEGERGDASQLHPRTGIGFSADGSKLVLMVVDGRSSVSAGCSTGTLGDLLLFAGCDEGMNLDGGGSSTLYSEAFGVLNDYSDSSERPVSNGVYAVLEAPEDKEIAELVFYDYNPSLPYLGIFTPRVMAFNKYGLALDIDFSDFTLSCPPELGEVINDGHTLYVTGRGCHALTARYGDIEVSVPVFVEDAAQVMLDQSKVIIDSRHPYTIGLYSPVHGNMVELNPAALKWTSADPEIASVSESGIISAVSNGTTVITGTVGDVTVEQTVTVENSATFTLPLIDLTESSSWRLGKSDINNVVYTPSASGFNIDFAIQRTRSPKITLTVPEGKTYGVPESFDFVMNPGETIVKTITMNVIAANSTATYTLDATDIPVGKPGTARIWLKNTFDENDLTIFPIEIKNIIMTFGNEAGAQCHLDVESLVQNYDTSKGVSDVAVDREALAVMMQEGVAFLSAPAAEIIVTDLAGRIVARGSGNSIALPQGHGVVILTADGISTKVAF